mgnify:FL=1
MFFLLAEREDEIDLKVYHPSCLQKYLYQDVKLQTLKNWAEVITPDLVQQLHAQRGKLVPPTPKKKGQSEANPVPDTTEIPHVKTGQ